MENSQIPYFSKNCNFHWTNAANIINPYDIANILNNYFASKAETTTKNTKKKEKQNKSGSKIFLQPTDKEEITNIISSLNSNKPSGPISIPYEISKQLPELFKYSFMAGVFPSLLKTPTLKKRL